MIEISKNISVDGFNTEEEFDKWLIEQEKKEPNSSVMKTFKWFLMKIEKADKSKPANMKDIYTLDKYANEVIKRKLMKENDVLMFVGQALKNQEELDYE